MARPRKQCGHDPAERTPTGCRACRRESWHRWYAAHADEARAAHRARYHRRKQAAAEKETNYQRRAAAALDALRQARFTALDTALAEVW